MTILLSATEYGNAMFNRKPNANILTVMMMTEKYNTIWDFCDWLSYQGLAYETLYYGYKKDIDKLIKRYIEDEKWHNRRGKLE